MVDDNDISEVESPQDTVVEALSSVRERPGMFVGDTRDGSGLHHLLWEVMANALDEHLAGRATCVHVGIENEAVEVEDDGGGIPLDVLPASEKSTLEVVFTTLHTGATWDGHVPHVHVSAGLHGVGVAAVNALSEELEVEVRRDGRAWRIGFARGEAVTELEDLGPTDARGTRVRFRPDPEIFGRIDFELEHIHRRMHEFAYLLPQLALTFQGQPLREPGGLSAWVEARSRDQGTAPQICLHASGEHRGVLVDVAAAWTKEGKGTFQSFVGLSATPGGGTHVKGFWEGVRRAISALDPTASTAQLANRLGSAHIVVHASLFDPRFGGPTRDHLLSKEAWRAVLEVVSDTLSAEPDTVRALRSRLTASV